MAIERYVPTFSDVNLDVNQYSFGDLVYDDASIEQSILMILNTPKGSRIFRPEFGAELEALLFEPMNEDTAQKIRYQIISSVEQWETRIRLQSTEVIPDYDNQSYYCELGYTIPALADKFATFAFNLAKQSK